MIASEPHASRAVNSHGEHRNGRRTTTLSFRACTDDKTHHTSNVDRVAHTNPRVKRRVPPISLLEREG